MMTDCLIIGGGLIGMLTARELVSNGMRVTLIDQGLTGGESSWAGGGILSPLYPWRYPDSVTDLATWSQAHYALLVDNLSKEGGIDPEYTQSGLLILEPEDAGQAFDWAPKSKQPLLPMDENEIKVCEPALQPYVDSAVWLPNVAQVRNPRLIKAVRQSLYSKVEVIENNPVKIILTNNGHVIGVETKQGKIKSEKLIVCAGAWTGNLLADFAPAPKIAPILGQMILFRSKSDYISRIVLHNNRYVIPRRDGRVLVGSTLEHRGFDKTTTQSARKELKTFALKHFPQLANAEIEHHWAGLRPSSPQGIPYIGSTPNIEGLFVNAGHYRNGVVLGPASARLMSDMVLGKSPILPIEPYALDANRD
jgi:glycine oxidase